MRRRKVLALGFLVIVSCAVALGATWPDLRRAWCQHELLRQQIEANRLPRALLEAVRTDPKLALFSLEDRTMVPPSDDDPAAAWTQPEPLFKGYAVARKVVVSDSRARQRLAATLEWVTTAGEPVRGLCFLPEHGLRARDRSGRLWKVLVCFHCYQILVFTADQEEKGSGMIKGARPGPFNELLKAQKPGAR